MLKKKKICNVIFNIHVAEMLLKPLQSLNLRIYKYKNLTIENQRNIYQNNFRDINGIISFVMGFKLEKLNSRDCKSSMNLCPHCKF